MPGTLLLTASVHAQVTILARRPDDELLLLASDGLWDVLSNQEACTLAKRCLRRARQRHASRQSAARIAATVLTRAAVDRGSRDNVTVSPFVHFAPCLPSFQIQIVLDMVSLGGSLATGGASFRGLVCQYQWVGGLPLELWAGGLKAVF